MFVLEPTGYSGKAKWRGVPLYLPNGMTDIVPSTGTGARGGVSTPLGFKSYVEWIRLDYLSLAGISGTESICFPWRR